MANYPREIKVQYQRHASTGLWAGFSDDLKGLMVTGRSPEEVDEEIPAVVAAIIEQRHGVKVEVTIEGMKPVAPGFESTCAKNAKVQLLAA